MRAQISSKVASIFCIISKENHSFPPRGVEQQALFFFGVHCACMVTCPFARANFVKSRVNFLNKFHGKPQFSAAGRRAAGAAQQRDFKAIFLPRGLVSGRDRKLGTSFVIIMAKLIKNVTTVLTVYFGTGLISQEKNSDCQNGFLGFTTQKQRKCFPGRLVAKPLRVCMKRRSVASQLKQHSKLF